LFITQHARRWFIFAAAVTCLASPFDLRRRLPPSFTCNTATTRRIPAIRLACLPATRWVLLVRHHSALLTPRRCSAANAYRRAVFVIPVSYLPDVYAARCYRTYCDLADRGSPLLYAADHVPLRMRYCRSLTLPANDAP